MRSWATDASISGLQFTQRGGKGVVQRGGKGVVQSEEEEEASKRQEDAENMAEEQLTRKRSEEEMTALPTGRREEEHQKQEEESSKENQSFCDKIIMDQYDAGTIQQQQANWQSRKEDGGENGNGNEAEEQEESNTTPGTDTRRREGEIRDTERREEERSEDGKGEEMERKNKRSPLFRSRKGQRQEQPGHDFGELRPHEKKEIQPARAEKDVQLSLARSPATRTQSRRIPGPELSPSFSGNTSEQMKKGIEHQWKRPLIPSRDTPPVVAENPRHQLLPRVARLNQLASTRADSSSQGRAPRAMERVHPNQILSRIARLQLQSSDTHAWNDSAAKDGNGRDEVLHNVSQSVLQEHLPPSLKNKVLRQLLATTRGACMGADDGFGEDLFAWGELVRWQCTWGRDTVRRGAVSQVYCMHQLANGLEEHESTPVKVRRQECAEIDDMVERVRRFLHNSDTTAHSPG